MKFHQSRGCSTPAKLPWPYHFSCTARAVSADALSDVVRNSGHANVNMVLLSNCMVNVGYWPRFFIPLVY